MSDGLPQTSRVMVKDEDLCVHCGLCAERCPTGAWDMQKSTVLIPYAVMRQQKISRSPRRLRRKRESHVAKVNDVVIKIATVNGTGSASANGLLHEVDIPHGRSRRRQELLSLQYSGPADLVRDSRHR